MPLDGFFGKVLTSPDTSQVAVKRTALAACLFSKSFISSVLKTFTTASDAWSWFHGNHHCFIYKQYHKLFFFLEVSSFLHRTWTDEAVKTFIHCTYRILTASKVNSFSSLGIRDTASQRYKLEMPQSHRHCSDQLNFMLRSHSRYLEAVVWHTHHSTQVPEKHCDCWTIKRPAGDISFAFCVSSVP